MKWSQPHRRGISDHQWTGHKVTNRLEPELWILTGRAFLRRRSLEQLSAARYKSLLGLFVLLEKTPEALRSWALDPSTAVEHKTGVIMVLEEELPGELISALPSFISSAHASLDTVAGPQDERHPVAYYCECLASLLLRHKEQVLPALSKEARSELRNLAQKLIVVTAPNSSVCAAVLLQLIGKPEDVALIEAHRPTDPTLTKVFDDAAQALHHLQEK